MLCGEKNSGHVTRGILQITFLSPMEYQTHFKRQKMYYIESKEAECIVITICSQFNPENKNKVHHT
jgi:hypothetical protein